MYKKFKEGELFVNRVKAHPKVEFFVNSGSVNSVHHNRVVQPPGSVIPDGYVALSNLVNGQPEVTEPVAGMTVWVDGQDIDGSGNGTLTNGQDVTTWVNKGSLNNYVSAGQPGSANLSPGPPGVFFTGTENLTNADPLSIVITAGEFEVFAVVEADSIPSNGTLYKGGNIIGDAGAYWGLKVNASGGNRWLGYTFDTSQDYATRPAVAGTRVLLAWRLEGGTSSLSVDGGDEGTVVAGNVGSLINDTHLGFVEFGTEFESTIHEVIVYPAALTEEERAENITYLQNKWGI